MTKLCIKGLLHYIANVFSKARLYLSTRYSSRRPRLTCLLFTTENKLQCGPVPNAMAALPNIGGALCSTQQSLADVHYTTTRVPCSIAAKTRNLLKLAVVPQTRQQISAVSGPKFSILCEHVEEILLFKFFPIVDMCLSCEDMARQSCAMVRRWRIFGDFLNHALAASRVQHVSDLHPRATPRVEVW